jgi:outer membrane lipoprotein-sorting protein
VILKRRPDKMRMRMETREQVMETGFDGTNMWRRFEQGPYDKVEQVTDPQVVASMRIEADFDGPLIGSPTPGLSLRLLGLERIDRADYFVIEVKSEDATALHYIHSQTFRVSHIAKTTFSDSGPSSVTAWFHDLEKHSGIWVARRVVKEFSNGNTETLTIRMIEMNPGILDFSFAMPKEKNPFPDQ